PVVGDSISFNSTATGGTSPYTFSWNFGDSASNVPGGTSLPNTMTHTYTRAGTYTVTVNATDTNSKIGSASATVTVTPPLVSLEPVSAFRPRPQAALLPTRSLGTLATEPASLPAARLPTNTLSLEPIPYERMLPTPKGDSRQH